MRVREAEALREPLRPEPAAVDDGVGLVGRSRRGHHLEAPRAAGRHASHVRVEDDVAAGGLRVFREREGQEVRADVAVVRRVEPHGQRRRVHQRVHRPALLGTQRARRVTLAIVELRELQVPLRLQDPLLVPGAHEPDRPARGASRNVVKHHHRLHSGTRVEVGKARASLSDGRGRTRPVRCSPTPPCRSCISSRSAIDRTCSFLSFELPAKRVTRPAACQVAPEQS